MKYLLIAVIAYLLGSVCASIPLSRRFHGADVRTQGSGNAGATNVARVFGIKAGLITLLCDVAKTVAAMLLGAYIGGVEGKALAGAFCIIGHCFPVYFGFKGGKGVSVGAALGLMSGIGVFLVVMTIFFITAFACKKVSLSSMLAAVSLPLVSLAFNAATPILVMNVFTAILVVFMHRGNIQRLLNGTEPDFRPKKSS